jgi:hypothetical protein
MTKMGDSPSFGNVTANLIEASVLEFTKLPSNAGHGGAVDFHFNGSAADYTSRIIEDVQGRISVYGSLSVNGDLGVTGDVWLAKSVNGSGDPPLP